MFHPSRGGVRGGQDQFSWDSVKEDRYRECYLGHSLMAPVGRWQKGKDLQWYAKDGDKLEKEKIAQRKREELIAVKKAEEDAMAEALGLKKRGITESDVSTQELQSVLRKEQELNEEDGVESSVAVKGLGFKHFSNTGSAVASAPSSFVSTGLAPGKEIPAPTKPEVGQTLEKIKELERMERMERKEEKRKRKELKRIEKEERRRHKDERKRESKDENSHRDGDRRRDDEGRDDGRYRRDGIDRSSDRRDDRRYDEKQRNRERRSPSPPARRTERGDRRVVDGSLSPMPHRSRYRSRSRSPLRSRRRDSQSPDLRNQKRKGPDDRYAERGYRRER